MKIRIDAADRLFSLFIRYRDDWTCQRCRRVYQPGDQGLHCSHFWGRANEATRFDPENASAHCFFCHQFFTANPEEHRAWKLKQIGEARFKALMVRANTYAKKDRKLMAMACKKLYLDEKKRYDERKGP